MSFEGDEMDQYGHRKLGGIGDRVAALLKERSPRFNAGRRVNVVNQRLGYLVRSGDPDALDSIVPMAFGNLALDLILEGRTGRLVALHNGRYDTVAIEAITGRSKVVDVGRYYHPDRLRPIYKTFLNQPLFFMTGDV
jgi:6-phosphofructokinase 1